LTKLLCGLAVLSSPYLFAEQHGAGGTKE